MNAAEHLWAVPWFGWFIFHLFQQCLNRRRRRTDALINVRDQDALSAFVQGDTGTTYSVCIDHVKTAPPFLCGAKGERLLDGQEMTLHGGELCAIMGPSGAGKTTLLRVLAGRLDRTLDARASLTASHQHVGVAWLRRYATYVPTSSTLPREWTVEETLSYYDLQKTGILSIAQTLNMENCLGRRIQHLSTGQLKRVLLGIAVLRKARVIFLDEPTSGLSDSDALLLMKRCDRIRKDFPATLIVMVLHQPRNEIFRLLDRVVLIHSGQFVWNGSVDDLEQKMESLGMKCPHPLLLPTHVADNWDKLPPHSHDTPRERWAAFSPKVNDALALTETETETETETFPTIRFARCFANWLRWDSRLWRSFLWHAIMLHATVAFMSIIFRNDLFGSAIMRRAQLMYTSFPLHLYFIVAFKRNVVRREALQRADDIYSYVATPFQLWCVSGWASWCYQFCACFGIVLSMRHLDDWQQDPRASMHHALMVFLCVRCTLSFRDLMAQIGIVGTTRTSELPLYICCCVHIMAEGLNGLFVGSEDLPATLAWMPHYNPLYYANAGILQSELGEDFDTEIDTDPTAIYHILVSLLCTINGLWLLVLELGAPFSFNR